MTFEEYLKLDGKDKIGFTSRNRDAINKWCSFTDKKLSSRMRVSLFLTKLKKLPSCKICGESELTSPALTCSPRCNGIHVANQRRKMGEDGLTSDQRGGLKISAARKVVGPDGTTLAQRAGKKMSATISTTGSDGLTISQRRVEKCRITKSIVGPDGLTPTERGSIRATESLKRNMGKIIQDNLERDRQKFGPKLTREYFSERTTAALAEDLGVTFLGVRGLSKRFNFPTKKQGPASHAETEITEYLQTVGITPKNNDRNILEGFELDLLILEHNLAIEHDGMYWHGYKFLRKHNPAESTASISKRHVNKTNRCEEKGITLYHIFENEWQNPLKRSIWKSMLRSAVGKSKRIYARKCSIMEIDNKTAGEFLDENHLQGSVNAMFRLALVHDNETVAIMTFGVSRYSKEYKYELLRMCNKKGITVVGGFSRLLKTFRRSHEGSIVSYANRRFSTGNVYEKNGFTLQRISPPCYWYFNSDNDTGLVHRSTFMKHKLNNVLDKFDPGLSEWENMSENGWDKIYDCGNLIYGLT